MDRKLLAIQLNDNLASATAGVELAGRARGSNSDGQLGELLVQVAGDLAANRAALEDVMGALDVGKDRVKQVAGWTGEKLGRLKPNGRLISHSPLSRVTELSALALIYQHSAILWLGLGELLAADERTVEIDFAGRAGRCEHFRAELERRAVAALGVALGG